MEGNIRKRISDAAGIYHHSIKIKRCEKSHRFILSIDLVKPPNASFDQDADKVDEPHEGDTNKEKDDGDNHANHVVLVKALADSVDPPNDVKCGDAENELKDLRQIVKGFNELFHFMSPIVYLRISAGFIIL